MKIRSLRKGEGNLTVTVQYSYQGNVGMALVEVDVEDVRPVGLVWLVFGSGVCRTTNNDNDVSRHVATSLRSTPDESFGRLYSGIVLLCCHGSALLRCWPRC